MLAENVSSKVDLPSGSSKDPISQPSTALSLNYDVLLGIFETLKRSSHGAKILLSVALVCTAFRDPAIDMLWESMDSAIPLLHLLPTVELVNGVYAIRILTPNKMICGDTCDKDMLRFKFYAKKIRRLTRSSLDHKGSQYPPIAPHVLALLERELHLRDLIFSSFEALCAPETPCLIPYCSTLYTSDASSVSIVPLGWVSPPDPGLPFIGSSSSLERVEIRDAQNSRHRDFAKDFSRMRPFMYALKTRASDLQHLVIDIQTDSRVWKMISNFKNLHSLEFSGVLDLKSFRLLAVSLPELQRLSVNLLDTSPLSLTFIDSDSSATFPFDKLCILKMSGRGLAVASYLKRMLGRNVQTLSIIIDNSNPPSHRSFSGSEEQQWDLSILAAKRLWASSLQSIHLETLQTGRIPMSAMFLSDLAAIPLTSLVIEAKISEQDCKMLCRSLISIHSLYIHRILASVPVGSGSTAAGGTAGIEILVAFATYCQNLVSMQIGFEERVATSFSYLSSIHPEGDHMLKTLVIISEDDCHDINNVQHLIDAARLLYRLFPVLETLRASDKHASAVFWENVYKLYKEFKGFADGVPWDFQVSQSPTICPPLPHSTVAPKGVKKKGKGRMN
ncbi:hypothetical protein H0H92_003607 [Tricholoma furcatifolium]|nr:hypothetical protein H0H92_003607 [Tricholoma furcatifolium]